MNIIFTIGIFMLASSVLMVAFVWIKDHFHKRGFVDIEIHKYDLLNEGEEEKEENELAA